MTRAALRSFRVQGLVAATAGIGLVAFLTALAARIDPASVPTFGLAVSVTVAVAVVVAVRRL